MLFTLKKFIGGLVLPLPLLLLVMGAWLVLLWLNPGPKIARLLLFVGWLLMALSQQPVVDRLLVPLEAHYPTWQPRGETVK